jgi:carboxypeptidase C (cathepsin A)
VNRALIPPPSEDRDEFRRACERDLLDAKMEEFTMWADAGSREPSMVMIWLAGGVGVSALLGLAYIALAVL